MSVFIVYFIGEMNLIKAVIFDMDGVIVDSEPIHQKAEKESLLKYGVKISTEELSRYTGTTAKFMYDKLILKYKINTTFDKILSEKDKILFKLLENNTRPISGIYELIEKLKNQNLKLGVASSSHKKLINFIIGKLKLKKMFDSIVGCDDIIHSKPHPEIFLKSAKLLNFNPDECIVIEDAKLGVEAAKKAGMKCIGYKNLNSGNQDLSKADIIIEDFEKLDVKDFV
tara:strand:+ start:7178 stop:7858 length:681 start_codon:yes stop_codon:yes gene_type:complete